MRLNKMQEKAVTLPLEQNIKVLAGPGTGKTSGVIVPRYEYLVDNSVKPDSILCVAFNTTMATELKSRLMTKYPFLSPVAQSQICTINAFCYRQLKIYWKNNRLPVRSISNDWHQQKKLKKPEWFIKDIIDNVYGKKRKPTDKEALEFITRFKMLGLPEHQAEKFFVSKLGQMAFDFIKVYRQFEQQLKRQNQLTFPDQLYLMERLLIEKPGFRTGLQSKISHVLLDEAQDATGQALRILITVSQEPRWNEIYKESE